MDISPRPTTFVRCAALDEHVGTEVVIATETFQLTGSFKFRAAYHLVKSAPNMHFAASSSGNFGQALALSCKLLGKRATIVMPDVSAQCKIDAVRRYGATVQLIDTNKVTRHEALQALSLQDPDAYVTNAYDDPYIVAGNASLGRELAAYRPGIDTVLVPVGGGGLCSGIITGRNESWPTHKAFAVVGVEPEIADDAHRSFYSGQLVSHEREPSTVADGVRTTSLGERNWNIMRGGLHGMRTVSEQEIRDGVKFLFQNARLLVEPTGALTVAAAMKHFRGYHGRICCVVSGGNVDPAQYAQLIQG